MSFDEKVYLNGYDDGQWDALAFLRGSVEDDSPFVAVCRSCERAYALWMLGWNLAFAAALKSAELKGKATAHSWNEAYSQRYILRTPVPRVTDFNDKWDFSKPIYGK